MSRKDGWAQVDSPQDAWLQRNRDGVSRKDVVSDPPRLISSMLQRSRDGVSRKDSREPPGPRPRTCFNGAGTGCPGKTAVRFLTAVVPFLLQRSRDGVSRKDPGPTTASCGSSCFNGAGTGCPGKTRYGDGDRRQGLRFNGAGTGCPGKTCAERRGCGVSDRASTEPGRGVPERRNAALISTA